VAGQAAQYAAQSVRKVIKHSGLILDGGLA